MLLGLTVALNVSENVGVPPSAARAQMHTNRMQTVFIIAQISLERVQAQALNGVLSE